MDPQYILLDEPFAGVDPIALGEVRSLLRVMTRLGIGVLVTAHNVRETLGLVDRAYIIEADGCWCMVRPRPSLPLPTLQRSYLGANSECDISRASLPAASRYASLRCKIARTRQERQKQKYRCDPRRDEWIDKAILAEHGRSGS